MRPIYISVGGGEVRNLTVKSILKEVHRLVERFNGSALSSLVYVMESTSPWTLGHSDRTTRLALEIGRVLGLGQEELQGLRMGGLLHDIGKLALPPEILNKRGPLSPEEMEFVRQHVSVGAEILAPFPSYRSALPIVLQHHERFDGSGYPFGLKGSSIALGARILAVADVYDALTAERPYRGSFEHPEALRFIKERAGSWFDPQVVEAFLEVVGY